MENSKEVPQENKFELPCDSGVLPGTDPDKTVIQKDMCTPVFIEALFTIAKTWKHPICSSDEWIRKMWCVHTHTQEYYSVIKRTKQSHLQQYEWIWRLPF